MRHDDYRARALQPGDRDSGAAPEGNQQQPDADAAASKDPTSEMRCALKKFQNDQTVDELTSIQQMVSQALATKRRTTMMLQGNWLVAGILTFSRRWRPLLSLFPLHLQPELGTEPPVTWHGAAGDLARSRR